MKEDNYFEFGRLKYIEPANPQNVGGNMQGNQENSIAFPYEDYNIAIDLSIQMANRYSCGDTGCTSTFRYSTTDGTLSFLGGTNGLLTTNYTNVTMTEPEKNTAECLGIESINITYNSWLYPQVVIKFVDVRGAAVMQPAEEAYYSRTSGGWAITDLYRALFTFPYPMYTLRVKGFYGKSSTYKLVCKKTDIELDSETGNFIITAEFIGYMFGIYSDVPMNFLTVAPYTVRGKAYWDSKVADGTFTFKDRSGNVEANFIKIPELEKKIGTISKNLEYRSAAAEGGKVMEDYSDRVKGLETLKTLYPFGKDGIEKIDVVDSEWLKGLKKLIVFKYSEESKKTLEEYVSCLINYDTQYGTDYASAFPKDFTTNKYLYYMQGETIKWSTGVDENTKFFKIVSEFQGKGNERFANLKDDIVKALGYNGEYTLPFIAFEAEGNKNALSLEDINEEINKYIDIKNEKVAEVERKKNEIIESVLGFRPSIRNFYELMFAHMDTFTYCFYDCLNNIKKQLDGDKAKRAKTTFNIRNGQTDTEDVVGNVDENKDCNYLPPFPAFYEKRSIDNAKELIWPGDNNIKNGNSLEEVKFVLELLSGAEAYKDRMDEALKEIEAFRKSGYTNDNGEKVDVKSRETVGGGDGYIGNSVTTEVSKFIPTNYFDFIYNRENPYDEAKAYMSNDLTNFEGSVVFKFALRTYQAQIQNAIKTLNGATKYGELEAYNLYKALGEKLSLPVKTFLEKYENYDNYVKAISESNVVSKCFDFGDSTNDKMFNIEGERLEYTYDNSEEKVLPLNVGNIQSIKRQFVDKSSLMYQELPYCNIPTVNTDIHKGKGSFNYGKPLQGGTFIVMSAGTYTDEIINKVKDTDIDTGVYYDTFFTKSEYDYYPSAVISTVEEDGFGIPKETTLNNDIRNENTDGYLVRIPAVALANSLFAKENSKLIDLNKDNKYSLAFLFLFGIQMNNGDNYGLVSTTNRNIYSKNYGNDVALKLSLLREGAFYWREDMMSDNNDIDVIKLPEGYVNPTKRQGFSYGDTQGIFFYPTTTTAFNYREWKAIKGSPSRRKTLKEMFLSWAENSRSDGFVANFKRLQNKDLYKNKEFNNGLDLSLARTVNSTVMTKANEDAMAVQLFLKDTFFGMCTTVSVGKADSANSVVHQNAFKSFIRKLKELFKDDIDKVNENPVQANLESAYAIVEDPFKSKELRLSVYMTLKSLYDKWLCSSFGGHSKWALGEDEENSDFNTFVYVDSFYNDIGYLLTVNADNIANLILSCFPTAEFYTQEKEKGSILYRGLSIYDYLTAVAENCGGILFAQPQKFGLSTKDDVADMFTPMNIFESRSSWTEDSSSFIFMYTYKPSEHLGDAERGAYDMNGWSREGDGFNLTDMEVQGNGDLFSNEGTYSIPAFGVTYARQNQSIFKNVRLSTEDAGVTDAALMATFNIATKAEAEGPRETTLYGQDIYRIYSQYSYNCEVEMMGNMQITPLMYFQLNNIPLWKGAYMIKKVVHEITPGNITTKFEGMRLNKYAIPLSELGVIISRETMEALGSGVGRRTFTPAEGNASTVSADGIRLTKQQKGNDNIKFDGLGVEEKDKITPQNPLFVFTPAHDKSHKAEEHEWSKMLINNYVIPKMKRNGLNCYVGGRSDGSRYDMTIARTLAKKFGSEKVVSIVPHWNGAKGSRFLSFYGLDKGRVYTINENSPYLSECFVNAAKAVKENVSSLTTLPKGAMNGECKSDGNLYESSGRKIEKYDAVDPALNFNYGKTNSVTPPAVLLENWYADYTTEKGQWDKFNGKKDSEGRFVSMVDWLRSSEGYNTISSMIVRGCLAYVEWLKSKKSEEVLPPKTKER